MTEALTSEDLADALAYLQAHLDNDHEAMSILHTHADATGMHVATTALLAGLLLRLTGTPDAAITFARTLTEGWARNQGERR
ncbi:hypothetical protein [Enemella evansiae]|uniref:hypothetical protein n=1 Tax=Enemella evansiae TaxID=2016499 RepID=UPI000B97BDDF|nr:hypothetical protein [Enemella evansiae]OYO05449.1 hypothetical protein CGZ97_01585 [Enemella evansiae]